MSYRMEAKQQPPSPRPSFTRVSHMEASPGSSSNAAWWRIVETAEILFCVRRSFPAHVPAVFPWCPSILSMYELMVTGGQRDALRQQPVPQPSEVAGPLVPVHSQRP